MASSDSCGVESDEAWFRRTVGEGWPGHELRPLPDFSLGDACADVGATTEDVGMGVESRDVSSDLDCDGCDSLWEGSGAESLGFSGCEGDSEDEADVSANENLKATHALQIK